MIIDFGSHRENDDIPGVIPPVPLQPDPAACIDPLDTHLLDLEAEQSNASIDKLIAIADFISRHSNMNAEDAIAIAVQSPTTNEVHTADIWRRSGLYVKPGTSPLFARDQLGNKHFVYDMVDVEQLENENVDQPPDPHVTPSSSFVIEQLRSSSFLDGISFCSEDDIKKQDLPRNEAVGGPYGSIIGAFRHELPPVHKQFRVCTSPEVWHSYTFPQHFGLLVDESLTGRPQLAQIAVDYARILLGHLGPCKSDANWNNHDDADSFTDVEIQEFEAQLVAWLFLRRGNLNCHPTSFLKEVLLPPYLESGTTPAEIRLGKIAWAVARLESHVHNMFLPNWQCRTEMIIHP